MSLHPSEFHSYFEDGTSWMASSGETITLSVRRLGNLALPSGRLIACDPAIPEDLPFTQVFPPGAYPVDVVIVHIQERLSPLRALWFQVSKRFTEDTRIALAAVIFQEAAPTRWEPASISGQLRRHSERDTYSYSVDSASGCFMDQRAAQAIITHELDVFEALDVVAENPADQPMWMDLHFRQAEPLNIIAFSSGWGDGHYASYIGFTDGNTVARVVTDFAVLHGPLIERRGGAAR
jgi:uncharacterized protein DUF4241